MRGRGSLPENASEKGVGGLQQGAAASERAGDCPGCEGCSELWLWERLCGGWDKLQGFCLSLQTRLDENSVHGRGMV